METSTIEYAQHLQGKIESEKLELEQAKSDHAQTTVGLSNQDTLNKLASIEEKIRVCQESIGLYKELMESVKMAVCQADDVWVPKSLGILGRMPWINLYSDWIKILLDNIVGVGGHRNAKAIIDIERYV